MSTTHLDDTIVLEPTPSAPQPGRGRPRPRRWSVIVAAALGLLVAAAVGLRLAHPGVLPGVHVAGTDLGGLSQEQLRTTLDQLADRLETDTLVVAVGDQRDELSPATVSLDVDAAATADVVWALGRDGDPFSATWRHVSALWRDTEVAPIHDLDRTALTGWVDQLAEQVDRPVSHGDLVVDDRTLSVTTTPPVAGSEVDRAASVATLARALVDGARGPVVQLPATVAASPIDPGTLPGVAATARAALREPLTVAAGGAEVRLEPSELAPLLTVGARGRVAELAIRRELVRDAFDGLAATLETDPQDARLAIDLDPSATLDDKGDVAWEPVPAPVRTVPSRPGHRFDVDTVADELGAALRAGQHTVTVSLPEVAPDFTTADADALGVDTLLGTFTTYHAPGQNRVTNIHVLADTIDGTIVRPGEQFSINRASGERTCAKGYVEDGMILGGKLVSVCGGGVSQFGTTTFNAAFFAGLQIDQHKPHSWYISRYPMGREATLDYATDIDVKFTNDTGHGLLIRTAYTSTSITVSIYGHSDVRRVVAELGAPHNRRGYPTQVVENPALAPGTERVVQHGSGGFDVDVTRTIERARGDRAEETFSHRYVPEPQIVQRNSAPPAPQPTPTPAPSDAPAPPTPTPSPPASPAPADATTTGDGA